MAARSPSGVSSSSRVAGSFSTGSDSPVSAASWTRRFAPSRTLPTDLHRGRGHALQGGHRPLRPVLLGEAQSRVEHDDYRDGYRVLVIPKKGRNYSRNDQNNDHCGGELFPQDRPRPPAAPLLQFVWTALLQPAVGLLAAQPRLDVGAQSPQYLLHLRGVPGASRATPALIH